MRRGRRRRRSRARASRRRRELTDVADPDPSARTVRAAVLGGVTLDDERRLRRDRSRLGAATDGTAAGAVEIVRARRRRADRAVRSARRGGRRTGRAASSSSTSRRPASAAARARWRFSPAAAGSKTTAFRVRQFFLSGPAGERAMLDGARGCLRRGVAARDLQRPDVRRAVDGDALGVSSDGRAPTDDLPHFDMLPPARRLWGRGEDCGRRRPTSRRAAA